MKLSRHATPALSPAATVHEVAREAGVSAATVSRYLNGTAKVSEEKRERIEQVIEQLNFKPNMLAQGLKMGSSRTIGVLTQSLTSDYFNQALLGVEEALKGTGYAPLIVSGHWHADEEAERIELLIARRVDGVVILTGKLSDAHILDFSRYLPIVAFGRKLNEKKAFGFCFDNYRAACEATDYLIAQGHRQIGFIAGPPDHTDAQERLAGYRDTLARHHIEPEARLIVAGDFQETGCLLAVNQLLESGVRFTALFAANDLTAYGARLALYRRAIRVPEDVSIVGFDDLHTSMFTTPPLTTVKQPVFEAGKQIAEVLLKMINKEKFNFAVPPLSLVMRESVRRIG